MNCCSSLRLVSVASLAIALVGCQATQTVVEPAENNNLSTGIHLQLHKQASDPQSPDAVTLVTTGETLHKAIRHAYPDAPITADSGIRLDQRLNVWAEALSPSRYLDYLGAQVDAEIRLNDRGEVEVRSTTQWAFTLPPEEAPELMPQAMQLARQAGATTMVLGSNEHILLISGNPSKLDTVRGALNQVSDRITLERNLKRLEAAL